MSINGVLPSFMIGEFKMEAWREDIRSELMHYGTKRHSGRYPYGSGERPYQGESFSFRVKKKAESLGTKVESLKKKRRIAKAVATRKKNRRDKLAEERKAIREEKQQKKAAEKRAKNSRDPKYIKKHLDEFTNDELREIKDRLNIESDYHDAYVRKINRGKNYVDAILGYAETGMKAYNTTARIINMFSDADNQLPLIGEKKQKKQKNNDNN